MSQAGDRLPAVAMEERQSDTEIRSTESIWAWPDATPSQRAAAFVLDFLVVGALCSVIEVFGNRAFEVELPTSLSLVVSFVYFVLLTSQTGQTLGKKMVGIKVVPLEQDQYDDGVPFKRVFLRETAYKLIGAVFLLYGYIRILTRKDRSSLHDALARTRVVSLSHERKSSPVSIGHVICGAVLLVLTLMLASFYAMHYTSQPLKKYARSLELLGFKVGRVEGNITHGFVVSSISQDTEDYSFELRGVEFRIVETAREGKRVFAVRDLSVKSASVTLRKTPSLLSKASEKKESDGPFGEEARKIHLPKIPGLVSIEAIDIHDIDFTIPVRPVYKIQRAFISELEYDQDASLLTIERFWVNSDPLIADVQKIFVQNKTVSVLVPGYIQLRPSIYPELLVAPIDVRFEALIEDGRTTNLSIKAFGDQVRVNLRGDSGEIAISKFTPLHYFRTELPIWNLDLHVAGDLRNLHASDVTGSLGIRNLRMAMDNFSFTMAKDKRRYFLAPRLNANLKDVLGGRDAVATLGSSDRLPAREVLSDLYFNRLFTTLSTTEREMLDHDLKYFADTIDAGPLLQAPIPLKAVAVVPVEPVRAPTAYVPKASGVPTKLPVYKKR